MGTTWRLCCRLDLSMRTTWLGYELTWYELTCNQPTTSPLPTTTWRHVQWCGVGRNSTTSQRPTLPSACPYRFCKSTKSVTTSADPQHQATMVCRHFDIRDVATYSQIRIPSLKHHYLSTWNIAQYIVPFSTSKISSLTEWFLKKSIKSIVIATSLQKRNQHRIGIYVY